jgi:hypothetical protein
MAASIEILSLMLAEVVGLPVLLHAHSSSEVALVYTFGIACGGLGSRLSAFGESGSVNEALTTAPVEDRVEWIERTF